MSYSVCVCDVINTRVCCHRYSGSHIKDKVDVMPYTVDLGSYIVDEMSLIEWVRSYI